MKKAAHKAGLIGKYDADGNIGFLDKKLRNSSKKALQASAAGRKAFDEVELEHDLTRQKKKRLRAGDDEPTSVDQFPGMNDVNMTDTSGMVLRAGGMGGEGANGTGETPVTENVPRELGVFTETRTAILPLRFFLSLTQLGTGINNNILKIRLNSPYNILRDTTFVNETEGLAPAGGPQTTQAQPYSATLPAIFQGYETTLIPAVPPTANTSGSGVVADANLKPAWRGWYEKIYESYHTIETKYKVTLYNQELRPGQRAIVYEDYDTYTASSSGNIMPTTNERFYYNTQWKRVKSHILAERNNPTNEPWIKTIEGTWKPGMLAKNTVNAEEIKAWYATGAEPSPQWVENLVLVGFNDTTSTEFVNINIMVELQYHVQFKDLKESFRYPQSTNPTIALNTPGDIMQVPNTRFGTWGTGA